MAKTIRSDFLVHWTGKCIQRNYKALNQQQRQKYMERLHSVLDYGFWMNWVEIELPHPPSNLPLSYSWPVTCFTEIKPRDSELHTRHYGCLGFAFTRKFVMERYGAPMLYVAGKTERKDEGAKDFISEHFVKLLRILRFLNIRTAGQNSPGHAKFREFIQLVGLGQFLKKESLDNRSAERIFEILSSSVISCAIFVKMMSDEDCEYAYQRLDEAEWRIPWSTKLPDVDPPIENVNLPRPMGPEKKNPVAKFRFYPEHLKFLILPDENMRKMVLGDQKIMNWFGTEDLKKITTVEDCVNGTFDPDQLQ